MDRRKLESAALFLTVAGILMIMPPLAVVFQIERRVLGIPSEVIYLFVAWGLLIAGAWWLGRHLPRDPSANPDADEG